MPYCSNEYACVRTYFVIANPSLLCSTRSTPYIILQLTEITGLWTPTSPFHLDRICTLSMFKSDLMKSLSYLRSSTLIWGLHQKLNPVVFVWRHQTLPLLSLKMMTVSGALTYKHYMLYTSERDHIFWTVLCVVAVIGSLALVLSDSVSVSIQGSVLVIKYPDVHILISQWINCGLGSMKIRVLW